jgi:hypothetical protein
MFRQHGQGLVKLLISHIDLTLNQVGHINLAFKLLHFFSFLTPLVKKDKVIIK